MIPDLLDTEIGYAVAFDGLAVPHQHLLGVTSGVNKNHLVDCDIVLAGLHNIRLKRLHSHAAAPILGVLAAVQHLHSLDIP